MRFETSHTLLSAAHATASHSPPLAPLPHVSATLEWANVSCVLSTVSPALREREKDKEKGKGVRCEAGFEVLSGCAADVAAAAVVCSCFFCVIA